MNLIVPNLIIFVCIQNLINENKSELRSILFRHLDGIVTVPTAYSLHNKGVLDYIMQHQKASLKELTEKFNANEGYLNVALRVLASQGWLVQNIDNQNDEITFTVTDKSDIAFSLIPLLRRCFQLDAIF